VPSSLSIQDRDSELAIGFLFIEALGAPLLISPSRLQASVSPRSGSGNLNLSCQPTLRKRRWIISLRIHWCPPRPHAVQ